MIPDQKLSTEPIPPVQVTLIGTGDGRGAPLTEGTIARTLGAIYEDGECVGCGALQSLGRHGPECCLVPLLALVQRQAEEIARLTVERDRECGLKIDASIWRHERDKWLSEFNRSEQFQSGPTKRAEAAEAQLSQMRETLRTLLAFDDFNSLTVNYCWYCGANINGLEEATPKQPHEPDCIGVKAAALREGARDTMSTVIVNRYQTYCEACKWRGQLVLDDNAGVWDGAMKALEQHRQARPDCTGGDDTLRVNILATGRGSSSRRGTADRAGAGSDSGCTPETAKESLEMTPEITLADRLEQISKARTADHAWPQPILSWEELDTIVAALRQTPAPAREGSDNWAGRPAPPDSLALAEKRIKALTAERDAIGHDLDDAMSAVRALTARCEALEAARNAVPESVSIHERDYYAGDPHGGGHAYEVMVGYTYNTMAEAQELHGRVLAALRGPTPEGATQ